MSGQNGHRAQVVMVSGPSGAGRSSAINALEDLGFEAIDNMPLSLIPRLLDGPPLPRPVALGVDVRNRDFSTDGMIELVDRLHRESGVAAELLFLECDTDTLVRRYSETRRRHPLSPDDAPLTGILHEQELLAPVRGRADVLIDTSALTPHQLRAEVARWFAPQAGVPMALSVQSFSYKRGLPRGVDMVFDCRFLSNPHWEPALRDFDGREPTVVAHIEADPRFAPFFERVNDLIASLLEAFVDEGKASLTIAFGCTGGKHRSVAMAERLAKTLADQGWRVSKRHRELERQTKGEHVVKQG
ncbi:RNase adapter RapZ [Pararhodobacter sp.]|uniref:RNase adapter RapZ n=1 Tax=Pararhodobacter sp. TaxID=2127056 RepID=UPI002FDCCDA9